MTSENNRKAFDLAQNLAKSLFELDFQDLKATQRETWGNKNHYFEMRKKPVVEIAKLLEVDLAAYPFWVGEYGDTQEAMMKQ